MSLPTPAIVGPPSRTIWRGMTCLEIAEKLKLTSGLEMGLDFGDVASYPGSGTTLTDVVGPNDWTFGDGSTATTYPTFNGVAGRNSAQEYVTFDGGDYFKLAVATPAWMQALHKDNAVGAAGAWVWFPNIASFMPIFATARSNSSDVGFSWVMNGSGPLWDVRTGSGLASFATGVAAGGPSQWRFVWFTLDEAKPFMRQGVNERLPASNGGGTPPPYNSPSSASATFTPYIGALPNPSGHIAATSRFANLFMWSRQVSMYDILRYGLATKLSRGFDARVG